MRRIPLRHKVRSVLGGVFRRRLERHRQEFQRLAQTRCRETQQATLQNLLRLNADSQFSRDFGLRPGLSLREFRLRSAVSDYGLVAPYIERMKAGHHGALLGEHNRLLMYAVTSGTTAESKLIPITDRFVADYRRGWQHWGVAAHMQRPTLRQLNMAQITSSHRQFLTADGVPCGNISGLVADMQSPMIRRLYSIPAAVAHFPHPVAKRYAVARFTYADALIGMLITANPSTLLQLSQFADDHADSLIKDIFDGTLTCRGLERQERQAVSPFLRPNRRRGRELESVLDEFGTLKPSACWNHLHTLGVWSGGSAGSYLKLLRQRFGDVLIRDHGLHASEGRMTIPIEDGSSAGILDLQSHFFEFIPIDDAETEDPIVLEAHELEAGEEYLILLTTSSGLYRYNIQDVVRCVDFFGTTPLLEFRHKGAHISSITGEKIAESQVVEAVRRACQEQELILRQFTMTPEWGTPPRYTLFLQPQNYNPSTDAKLLHDLSLKVDQLLRQTNCEYDEKRSTDRLASVRARVLADARWDTFMTERINRSGSSMEQYKHPCLLPDPQFTSLFLSVSRTTPLAVADGA